jgi:uncharacterized protein DUF4157
MRQQITKFGMFFAARVLTLGFLVITVGLPRPAPSLAQDGCQELNGLRTFDYRSWGIGVHRNCEWYDPICNTLKVEQIAAGLPVLGWIEVSREAAISAGVSPMPEHIRTQLAHLFPASLLDSVRYKTGSGFLLTLQWFRDELEGTGAITLKDVIVFANASKASCDVKLWAHELEHVRQYGNLGVDGFAQAYFDQTCILPGNTVAGGYKSDKCQLERRAEKMSGYFSQRERVLGCTFQKAPANVILRGCPLNKSEDFIASDAIHIGPEVTLQPSGNVILKAGRVINMAPGFQTEPAGKLSASIVPELR